MLVLKERLRWTDGLAFALIFSGVAISLAGANGSKGDAAEAPLPALHDAKAALPLDPAAPPASLDGGDDRRRLLDVELAAHLSSDGGLHDHPSDASPLLGEQQQEQQQVLQRQQRGGGPIWSSGSAEVLLASGVDAHARSSAQQEVHARGHPQAQPEA